MGGLCFSRFRFESHCVFVFTLVLAVSVAIATGGLLHDGRDGCVEHVVAGDGARSLARTRNGSLLDDVHGYGAVWCSAGLQVAGARLKLSLLAARSAPLAP